MFGILSKLFHKQIRVTFEQAVAPILRRNPTHWPDRERQLSFKEYVRMPSTQLPPPPPLRTSLSAVLERRCSAYAFSTEPISLEALSSLLHHAAGIKQRPNSHTSERWHTTTRFYPSAGARYPLEIYVYAHRIEQLALGLYHYNVKKHALEKLLGVESKEGFRTSIAEKAALKAPLIIFVTAVWDRTFQRYQDFGYRLVLLEAGHMAQNIQLASCSLNLASLPFADFSNEKVESVLGLTSHVESTLYAVAVGKATSED